MSFDMLKYSIKLLLLAKSNSQRFKKYIPEKNCISKKEKKMYK